MTDHLRKAFPALAKRLPKTVLANLPTPLTEKTVSIGARRKSIAIKCDDLTGKLYGGNKVRKLEYLLRRARDRGAGRVVTFGTVASNHALATALYASTQGLECTCLLSHQTKTPNAAVALNLHLQYGTEIVRFGGTRATRLQTMRQILWHRHVWVIPMGGSCWLGSVGFVNAGLELADQLSSGGLRPPDRLYVANGTMGTAAGLALGLALAGLETEIQAVRVTHERVANPTAMRRLMDKTATLMHRIDASIPVDLADRVRLCFRDEFFAGGYARTDDVTDRAITIAREQLGLALDTSYTGKAMAAMLHDAAQPKLAELSMLFWNTHNSRALPLSDKRPDNAARLPAEFLRYFD